VWNDVGSVVESCLLQFQRIGDGKHIDSGMCK